MSEKHAVILFHTSSHAIRAEKVLQKQGMPCKLIPVPRHLSSDCGVCARILRSDQKNAQEVLEKSRVEIVGVHDI